MFAKTVLAGAALIGGAFSLGNAAAEGFSNFVPRWMSRPMQAGASVSSIVAAGSCERSIVRVHGGHVPFARA